MIDAGDKKSLEDINAALVKLKTKEHELMSRVDEVRALAREYRLQRQRLRAKIEESKFPSSIGPDSVMDLPSSRSPGV